MLDLRERPKLSKSVQKLLQLARYNWFSRGGNWGTEKLGKLPLPWSDSQVGTPLCAKGIEKGELAALQLGGVCKVQDGIVDPAGTFSVPSAISSFLGVCCSLLGFTWAFWPRDFAFLLTWEGPLRLYPFCLNMLPPSSCPCRNPRCLRGMPGSPPGRLAWTRSPSAEALWGLPCTLAYSILFLLCFIPSGVEHLSPVALFTERF